MGALSPLKTRRSSGNEPFFISELEAKIILIFKGSSAFCKHPSCFLASARIITCLCAPNISFRLWLA